MTKIYNAIKKNGTSAFLSSAKEHMKEKVNMGKQEGKTGTFSYLSHKEKFKFEKLLIWQWAMELGEDINAICDGFPKKEMYNLSSQI